MADNSGARLLDVALDAWDRNQQILLNLLRAVPEGGLGARALAGSPTVAETFTHLHHERMVSVLEEAPECAGTPPEREWVDERDAARIEEMLVESARRVREAVKGRVEAGRQTELAYDHPLLLLQLLLFHEAYHHGQIKLALKAAGMALDDQFAGPLTWRSEEHTSELQ
mgnify:CR=1 FL=1